MHICVNIYTVALFQLFTCVVQHGFCFLKFAGANCFSFVEYLKNKRTKLFYAVISVEGNLWEEGVWTITHKSLQIYQNGISK